jgi:hypothetical protein
MKRLISIVDSYPIRLLESEENTIIPLGEIIEEYEETSYSTTYFIEIGDRMYYRHDFITLDEHRDLKINTII